jgi:hypothetical protein
MGEAALRKMLASNYMAYKFVVAVRAVRHCTRHTHVAYELPRMGLLRTNGAAKASRPSSTFRSP